MTDNRKYDEMDAAVFKANAHFDDAASIFLARELTHVRAQVLTVKKAPLNAFTVFPVQTDIPQGADVALLRTYDNVGSAKLITNYSDDLPRADVAAIETAVKVHHLGASYGYSLYEVRNAAFARKPLTALKGTAARQAIDIKLNDIAWNGDSKSNITGFLGQKFNEYAPTADGANGSTALKDKTEEQIIKDFNDFLYKIPDVTNEVEQPNTVLLPPALYSFLATKRLSDSDRTLLDFIQKSHPEVTRWIRVGELKGAGKGGKDVMFAGNFTPEYVKFEIPDRFTQLPVQYRNLEYVVDCVASTAGVTVTMPAAFVKAVGI